MVTHVNWTSCGDCFALFTNSESLCCTPETNLMVYVNHTSIKKIRKQAELREEDVDTCHLGDFSVEVSIETMATLHAPWIRTQYGFISGSQASLPLCGCFHYLLNSETRSRGWHKKHPRRSRRWSLSWHPHRRPRHSPQSNVMLGSDPGAHSCLWPPGRRYLKTLRKNTGDVGLSPTKYTSTSLLFGKTFHGLLCAFFTFPSYKWEATV